MRAARRRPTAVAEWASLKAVVADTFAAGEVPQTAILGQVRAREVDLGLTLKARLAARVQIVDVDPDATDDGLDAFWATRFEGDES